LSPIRILGSVLSVLNGALAVYIHYSGGVATATTSVSTTWLAVVGGVLVVDSLVSFAGVRMSFAVGAALSAVVLALVALQWGSYVATDAEVAAVLSAICIALDAIAFRPARGLSEKDSPLNLPVFG
jgi:hypothetical protein